MTCEPFSVYFSGNAEQLFKHAADLIQQHHGTLAGTPAYSTFSVPIRLFGTVAGYFTLNTYSCTITITEHPVFLPCAVIQHFVHAAIVAQTT